MASGADVLKVALAEVGYLEKASNYNLDSKTANAGYNNYTKYGKWYGMNGQPWCDMFVSWCAAQAGALSIVGKYAYVPSHTSFFRSLGRYHARGSYTPVKGDVIIFKNESHIGLVNYVSNGYVYTVEGNTSSGSTLVPNGGGVYQKSYPLTSSYIQGYGNPKYTSTSSSTSYSTENAMLVQTGKNWMSVYTSSTQPATTSFKQKYGYSIDYNTVPVIHIPYAQIISNKSAWQWVGGLALVVDVTKKTYTYAVIGDISAKGLYSGKWCECSSSLVTKLGYTSSSLQNYHSIYGATLNLSIYVYTGAGSLKFSSSGNVAKELQEYGYKYGSATTETEYADNAASAALAYIDLKQHINWNALTPYLVTVDRSTQSLDFKSLVHKKVVGVLIEGGCLYDALHTKQKFRNSQLVKQVEAAQAANLYWGFYMTARARTIAEVKEECYQLSFIIRKYPPLFGVWITTNFFIQSDKDKTHKLLDAYQEQFMRLGLVGKFGLLSDNNTLKYIDWEDTYCKDWSYWMVDHVASLDDINKLLEPEFWAYGSTEPAKSYGYTTSSSNNTLSQYSTDVFVGDSRTVAIKNYKTSINAIAKSGATYTWLASQKSTILQLRNSNIIFWWGANDFVSGDTSRAQKYADFFNSIYDSIGAYNTIYVASCGPFASSHMLSKYTNELVQFNNAIKSKINSRIRYLDIYTYLTSNGFNTLDGVHYTTETTSKLYTWIIQQIHGGNV